MISQVDCVCALGWVLETHGELGVLLAHKEVTVSGRGTLPEPLGGCREAWEKLQERVRT